MRAITLAVLAGLWVYSVMLYSKLPSRIATHFDIRGQADAWSGNPLIAWFALPALATVTLAFVYGISAAARRTPSLWNFPQKKEFLALTPEQRAPIIERMMGLIDVVGLFVVTLMWVAQYSVYRASTGSEPSLPWLFHVVLWGGLAGVIIKAFIIQSGVKKMVIAAGMQPVIGRTSVGD